MLAYLEHQTLMTRDSSDQDSPNGSSDYFDDEDLFDYQAAADTDDLDDTGSSGNSDSDSDET